MLMFAMGRDKFEYSFFEIPSYAALVCVEWTRCYMKVSRRAIDRALVVVPLASWIGFLAPVPSCGRVRAGVLERLAHTRIVRVYVLLVRYALRAGTTRWCTW